MRLVLFLYLFVFSFFSPYSYAQDTPEEKPAPEEYRRDYSTFPSGFVASSVAEPIFFNYNW